MKTSRKVKSSNYDYIIIGAGIIGSAIAREIAKYDKKTLVLESNARVGIETSQGNSGAIHCGFDPTPSKLNARLNILGKKRYEDWIKELEFPYARVPSLVIAFDENEMQHVEMLYKRGLTNGVPKEDLKILNKKETLQAEPLVNPKVKGALYCSSSMAVDTVKLTEKLMENAITNGVELKINSKVISIKKEKNEFVVTTSNKEKYRSKFIINVAGHYADEIAKMAGYPDFKLTTLRGEYRVLEKSERSIVKNIVFKVPTIYGKGVIVAPTLDGHILVGPTAEPNVAKEDTRLVTAKMFEHIGKIGKDIIPTINMNKTSMTFSGSRPIEAHTDDFYIRTAKKDDHFINVAGMKSPAIAAAPAIADYVIEMIEEITKSKLKVKKNWNPIQKSILPLK